MSEFGAGGVGQVQAQAQEVREALEGLKAPAEEAASAISEAFEKAGQSLSRSLVRAAADGKISLAEVARMVLDLVGHLATARGTGLSQAVSGAISSAGKGFSGTRADGGPVMGGGAYLVGERGPEVFRPHGAGTVEPVAGSGGVTVNVSVDGGAEGLLRSEAQIARMLARAAALGARGL